LLASTTVQDALWKNGEILGVDSNISSKSPVVRSEVPESLQPTPLQLATVHPLWIDKIPFPKMRDNLIVLIGVIDEAEFVSDLFKPNSFAIHSNTSWDPAAWRVGEEFWKKWKYLFY
jgi:hypothetical protein